MGRIVELSPTITFDDVIATKGAGYKPDFRIFTAGIESDRKNDRLVHMVGSSTEKDLQGDTMSIFALQSMTKAAPNLTVWLNHDYTLPDSIFGSILETPVIHHRDGIADLQLSVDVELENPAAARVKRFIDNGRRLGCSIGCMVTKYEVADEDDDPDMWGMRPIIIHDVYVVEYSVVGIPANQRSWVENAIRGVFTRTFDPGLVPAMKALWPSAYRETLKALPSDIAEQKQQQFERIAARPAPQTRLGWEAKTQTFTLSRQGLQKTVDRAELAALLQGKSIDFSHGVRPSSQEQEFEQEDSDYEVSFEEDDALLIKGVCGKTSWPLDRDAAWDKSAAHAHLLEWAGGKDDFSPKKFKQVHFWYDNDGSTISDYSYPFCDVKNGKVTAIWKAITAAAAAVAGARSGQSEDGAKGDAIRKKLAAYYRKAGETPPWQDDEKADTLTGVTQKDIPNQIDPQDPDGDGDVDTTAGPYDDEGLVMLHADGINHDAFNGSHTHEHDAYGYEGQVTHKHTHTHLNDNNHNHDNSVSMAQQEGKGMEPEKQAHTAAHYARNSDGTVGVALKSNGDHVAYKGTHTHHHDSFGHGDVEIHSHQHYHHNDNDHAHDHTATAMGDDGDNDTNHAMPAVPTTNAHEPEKTPALDMATQQILASYNGMGKLLGLPEITPAMMIRKEHPTQLETGSRPPSSTEEYIERMYALLTVMQQKQPVEQEKPLVVLQGLSHTVETLTRSLDALGDVVLLKKNAEETRADILQAKKVLADIQVEVVRAAETVAQLKSMPLGNPVQQNRTVTAQQGTVTHDELRGIRESRADIASDSLSQALALTDLQQQVYQNGQMMRYRHWPEGVGGSTAKGVRPPLTSNQLTFMGWDDIVAYREGREAYVPYLDTQVDNGPVSVSAG